MHPNKMDPAGWLAMYTAPAVKKIKQLPREVIQIIFRFLGTGLTENVKWLLTYDKPPPLPLSVLGGRIRKVIASYWDRELTLEKPSNFLI